MMNIPLNIVHIFYRFNVVVAGKKYSKDHNNESGMEMETVLMTTVLDENCFGKY